MGVVAAPGEPSQRVVEAFGATGKAQPLVGGQARAWLVAETVFKPLDMTLAALRWQAELLGRMDGRSDFRVSPPLISSEGSLVVDGWTAWRFGAGHADPRRVGDIVAAGAAFHTALGDETMPTTLAERRDRWGTAD